jgi:hypothetical protein
MKNGTGVGWPTVDFVKKIFGANIISIFRTSKIAAFNNQ